MALGWFSAAFHCSGYLDLLAIGDLMSAPPKTRPKVPEGKTYLLTTTQKEANDKGFVGYTTTWEEFQKEVPYQTPKRP